MHVQLIPGSPFPSPLEPGYECQDIECVQLRKRDCHYGVVKDPMECCNVCAKSPGDYCGLHTMPNSHRLDNAYTIHKHLIIIHPDNSGQI